MSQGQHATGVEWVMVRAADYLALANALGTPNNPLAVATQRLGERRDNKDLAAVATGLCNYWDSLAEGSVVDNLIHAMNRLGRVTGHQGLKDRVRNHLLAAHKMQRSSQTS